VEEEEEDKKKRRRRKPIADRWPATTVIQLCARARGSPGRSRALRKTVARTVAGT